MRDILLTGRACKIVIPLEPERLAAIKAPDEKRATLRIQLYGRMIIAEIASKSLRRAIATIAEYGPEGVISFVQGKLMPGNIVQEAGLIVQPKAKVPMSEPAM